MTTDPERPAIEVTDLPEEGEVLSPGPPQSGQGPLPDFGEAELGLADRQTPDDS
jgi:hypothetical protein